MKDTSPRLRVSYGKCSPCNVIAEYYYDLNDIDQAFIESCINCKAAPSNLIKVIVTNKGDK
jgi:hypothetical protein